MIKRIITAATALLVFTGIQADESYKGFPDKESSANLKTNFRNPPKGYGNVPFYWWTGDSLVKERLADQLEILSGAPIDGFAVSYMHTNPRADKVNAEGYGGYGKADEGRPGVFTDDWWDVWNWFAGQCADKGIGLGLDDYVVGWEKNGFYIDEVLADPAINSYQGRLVMKKYDVAPGSEVKLAFDSDPVSATLYPAGINLSEYIKDGNLNWKSDLSDPQTLYVITTRPSHELHPDFGRRVVDVYFDRFNNKLDERGRRSLNYFFQDELTYGLNIHSWAEDLPEEFIKRKGYDVRPYLAALFEPIGDVTPKVRLDYADVVTALAEERYFKPIFDWHNSRGLIYGCDNNGRGLEPLEYLDYFRQISWFTAPGNDAPARGSSFRQTKVSSSISHLYQRPRTWLEAFHSMGWDSNGEWLTSQLDHHMIAGGNLVCLHGLYYSTHGGWWEWAPPCFHFRMPYWPHTKKWLEYVERMSYLLSQGDHVCDIAVLYPTESMQAYPGETPDMMWRITDDLSARGLDYDFIDYHSLADAATEGGALTVGKESYKVIILPNVTAMHQATLEKLLEFSRAGGIIISTGNSLKATTLSGENNPKAAEMWNEIFASPLCVITAPDEIPAVISRAITPDFIPASGKGNVLHRRIGDKDVYMVMNVEPGDEMFFRAKGGVERWDAASGTTDAQPIVRTDDNGTYIRFDGEGKVSRLYVFSPDVPVITGDTETAWTLDTTPLDGEWDIEIIPTMNNKWGDFRLPATDEMIGPEAREFTCRHIGKKTAGVATTDIYGYAPLMEMALLDSAVNLDSWIASVPADTRWETYSSSWQYGVKDNPGSQGYHGLKGKVDDRFMILDRGGHQIFRTNVYAPADGQYVIRRAGVTPDHMIIDNSAVTDSAVSLKRGWHNVMIAYANTPESTFNLVEQRGDFVDDRSRSAVVFYPAGSRQLKDNDPYGQIVAMKWFDSDRLPYSLYPESESTWEYQFATAPGTEKMSLDVKGDILSVAIDGKRMPSDALKRLADGKLSVAIPGDTRVSHRITMTAKPEKGYDGPAFFLNPVKFTCGKGRMEAGNWTDVDGLKYFSGGIRYSKDTTINKAAGEKIELDLGMVDATCEVTVNGRPVEILINPPYRLDITEFVTDGSNHIEVLVYSSLSNHYQTVPSGYRGTPRSGLLGPVAIKTYRP